MWARGPFDYLHYYFSRELLARIALDNGVSPAFHLQEVFFIEDLVVAQMTKSILAPVRHGEPLDRLALDHIAMVLGAHTLQQHCRTAKFASSPRPGLEAWQKLRAEEMLRASLEGNVTVGELARACSLSRAILRDVRVSLAPAHQRLIQLRVEHGKQLLSRTRTLSERSSAVGILGPGGLYPDSAEWSGYLSRWRRAKKTGQVSAGNDVLPMLSATSLPRSNGRKQQNWRDSPRRLSGHRSTVGAMDTFTQRSDRLTRDNALLLLIDHQVGLYTGVRDIDVVQLKHNIVGLTRAMLALKVPVIVTTTTEKMWGPLIPELAEVVPGVPGIERTTVNAWDERRLVDAVKATGRKNLIVTGISTDVCLAFPAIAALADGFQSYAVIDASGGFSQTQVDMGIVRMQQAGVVPVGYSNVAIEILADNAAPEAGAVYAALGMPFSDLVFGLRQYFSRS
jgi:nicotinamidase-related amidase